MRVNRSMRDNWVIHLDHGDRLELWSELTDAVLVAAAADDVTGVEKCQREWRTTAQALSDPQRREVLTARDFAPADLTEVSRP